MYTNVSKLNEYQVREIIAESGKMRINDIMSYLKHHCGGKYDIKLARKNAREMVAEMQ